MASDNREGGGISRRHALECMGVGSAPPFYGWFSGGVPPIVELARRGRKRRFAHRADEAKRFPVIVKDTTSAFNWQTVLAGARKAGQDFGVEIAELGAQSEIRRRTVRSPFLRMRSYRTRRRSSIAAPAHFAALGPANR